MIGGRVLKDIVTAINAICYSIINKIDVNLANKEVVFSLSLVDNGAVTNHELRFINCTSFVWIEKMGDDNLYDFKKCDYYELTAVNLRRINTTSTDKWLKQYSMEYNVAVEIWETALLINSTELSIDHQHFSISG